MINEKLEQLPDWVRGNRFFKAVFKEGEGSATFDYNYDDKRVEASPDEANLISSVACGEGDSVLHYVMLDIDMPAALIPSSTPGHYHLYIKKTLTHTQYGNLLNSLNMAGIVQDGIIGQFKKHGCTSLRPPWVKKEIPPFYS